ncbi:heavy metal translocating P-type ATPase [Heliorestis convoluta]|nr:heavy metal translocating P-type ATPase [Heliorestis convoluta]
MTEPEILQVDGITCMDCARTFEKHVQALPGVEKAGLNAVTGRLTIEGRVDLEAIQKLGAHENYRIYKHRRASTAHASTEGASIEKSRDWRKIRLILSGFFLTLGFVTEWTAGPEGLAIGAFLTALVFGGWGNFMKASRSLPKLQFNMSVLMTIAVLGAVAIGQWEEGATVAFLFALSEMLEGWTMDRSRRSIRQLMDLSPKVATVRRGCSQKVDIEIPVEEIRLGDIMMIAPGQKIAMDGRIIKGQSALQEAAITGESVPVEKGPGDEVFAGTLNSHGALEVKVTRRVQDSTIAKIIHLVEEAQTKRAPAQAFVERFAAVYTPIVMALALLIAVVPPLFWGLEWSAWIYRGLALLVVACPCALVVSTPVAIVSAISKGANHGLLIKGGLYLEEVGALKAIAFDKTGTLTGGEPVVTDTIAFGSLQEKELLQLAASVESPSEHPLAKAIIRAAHNKGLSLEEVNDFKALPGQGAVGTVRGRTIYIGNRKLFAEKGLLKERANLSSDRAIHHNVVIEEIVEKLQAEGKTAMLVGDEKTILGIVAVADEVRSSSAATLQRLKALGIKKIYMFTGDNPATAKAIAAQSGVEHYQAELLPHEKVEALEKVMAQHGKVAMVGDGINDAPALARSTVAIAMGGAGTDTALETADIVLMKDDLTKLPYAIALSRKAMTIIRQNITFSIAIKVIAVLAVFPGWLTLWLAILADMGATILVTLNSLRLLGYGPDSFEKTETSHS